MKFSPIAATLCLAGSAFASPIGPIAPVTGSELPLPDVTGVTPERLAELAPAINDVVSGFGLGGLAPKLGDIAAPEVGIKTEPETEVEVEVEDGVLEVEIEVRISGLTEEQISKVLGGLKKLVAALGLDKLAAGEEPSIEGISPEVANKITSALKNILATLGLGDLVPGLLEHAPPTDAVPSAFEVPEVTELPEAVPLGTLAPDFAEIITNLGLDPVAPALTPFLTALSKVN